VTEALQALDEERSVDAFLGGRVTLVQPRKGHRAGLDAALLQALVPSDAEGLAIDLGAGVGTVAFCIAARAEKLTVIGIERDAGLVACGIEALGGPEDASFAERVRLIEGDTTDPRALRERAGFRAANADFVLMNPPFDPEGRVSESPDKLRRAAHVAAEGLIQSWSASAAAWLKPGGMLGLIHRADALSDVLDALSHHFGGVQVLPVHPTESAAAIRILVTAKRGSRAPLALRPGLVLHEPDGTWTPRADAILRGQAELAL
jgi:tRNA1(Val) A37 N6-methylase TrmN6